MIDQQKNSRTLYQQNYDLIEKPMKNTNDQVLLFSPELQVYF